MRRSIFIFSIVIMMLLAPAAVFASSQSEEETAAAAAEGPQYGGTLTVIPVPQWANRDATSPDVADGTWDHTQFLGVIQEKPFIGDFETYGPRGTGDWAFQSNSYIPEPYLTGALIESWEVTPQKVSLKVREGVYWHGNKPHIMKSRELVAADVVADLVYYRDKGPQQTIRDFVGEVRETGKYTLEFDFIRPEAQWIYFLGYEDRALISPPELEGSKVWNDQLGTGPYMLDEYVVGAQFTYSKNPDWWKSTTIDGVEYNDIPFIEKIIWPIMPDESTRMAALRTGKIDWLNGAIPLYFDSLSKTKGLTLDTYYGGGAEYWAFTTTKPPFDNLNVRRALAIGTDRQAFVDLYRGGDQPLLCFPLFPEDPTVYTPLEDLPQEIQELHEYDPEKARRMLDAEGIPEGFKLKIATTPDAASGDEASLLKALWEKIGINATIETYDNVAIRKLTETDSYTGVVSGGLNMSNPVNGLWRAGKAGYYDNRANWSNDRYEELLTQIGAEFEAEERFDMIKEAALIIQKETPVVTMYMTQMGVAWWPWVKNYYGEVTVDDYVQFPAFMATAWIDQSVKDEMGF